MDELKKILENDKYAADMLKKAEDLMNAGKITPEEFAKNKAEVEIMAEFRKAVTIEEFNAANEKWYRLRGEVPPAKLRQI